MTDTPLLRIPADLKNLSGIRRFVEESAAAQHVTGEPVADMVQAVDEAATNVIVHAYRGGPGIIEVEVERAGEWLIVRMRDQGPPFDPTRVPAPDLTIPLAERQPGGLGIHLMRQFTDKMTYRTNSDGANELTLMKRAIPSG